MKGEKLFHPLISMVGMCGEKFMASALTSAEIFLHTLNAALDAASKFSKNLSEKHQLNKEVKKFREAIEKESGSAEITVSNTTLYKAEGYRAEKTASLLREHNIPAVVLSNNKDSIKIIAVPAQYQRESDRIVSSINGELIKTEVTRDEFMRKNLNNDVVKFGGLSKVEVELIRNAMVNKDIEFCTEKNKDDEYTIVALKENQIEMGNTVFFAMAETRGIAGESKVNSIEQKSLVSHEVLANRHINNREVYFGDAVQRGLYRIANGKLEYIKDGRSEIIAEKHDPDFDAKIYNEIHQMKAPVSVVMEENKAIEVDKTKLQSIEGLASREEVARAKKSAAVEEGSQGHIQEAQILAAQIAALSINSGSEPENKEAVTSLNSAVSFSQVCSEESKSTAEAELKQQYLNLHLTEEQDRAVMDHVKDVNDTYSSNRTFEKVLVTSMCVADMEKWLRDNDTTIDEHGIGHEKEDRGIE